MSTFLAQTLGSKIVIAQTRSSRLQGFKQTGVCWHLLHTAVSFLSSISFYAVPLPSLLPVVSLSIIHCFDILNIQELLCIFLS